MAMRLKQQTLIVTADFTKSFNDLVKKIKGDVVLVGIPEEDPSRRKEPDEDTSINNATLLAINNFGSPANNIPPRPVMEVGIRNAQDEISQQFRSAAINALSGRPEAVERDYGRAGMIGANSIKKAINDQDFDGADGPSDATLAIRQEKGFKGTKSLIVTGQMRNAITYVVKGKG